MNLQNANYGNGAGAGRAPQNRAQGQAPQSAQSASSGTFMHLAAGGQKPNQKTNKIGVKALQGAMVTSQSFQRGSSTGQQASASEANNNNGTALSTDDGFLRGARIAEKIQEYYHTN